MDLNVPAPEHLAHMIEGIKSKLRVATAASIKAEHFSLDHYADIKDLYDLVMGKERFSISEIEALCDELKHLKG
ncbi:DUF1128 domain-containing protein [Paenibacillus thermoaerophilus]|uniref:DUF1128 domain-containing protein n=1 Tax=Paenibacillus thermoaerophilus TaxID=1215385 RepID=A0ABW2V8L4_9BACL|nr:DUF1128 domain-containing protein [Paenibacillus thermoaerophilus]TMV16136.1 DUF1128 domain-containing protein [Paenibacillus thermoaerophilus]